MDKKLLKSFSKYVSLNVLGMIGLSCYILADTFFISKALGALGIAALNFSISIYSIIHGTGLMIGIGGATRFCIEKAKGKEKDADIVFSSSIKLGLIVGLIFTLVGLFGAEYLALLLGADEATLPLTKTYLSTILIFAPFFIINNIMIAFVRNDNNPKLSMTAMLIGSFSNIILDYLFMFPLKMGMFGAAFATCLAPMISICILLVHFKKKNFLSIIKNKGSRDTIYDICSLGLSAFIIEISSAVVLIVFNLVILRIEGNLGVAAYGIVANLALVGTAVFTGIAQGMQPLTSKYYGLNNSKFVKKVRGYALITASVISMIIYIIVVFCSENIIEIFNSEHNEAIAQIADKGLRIYFLGFFFVAVNIVTSMFLSSTEKAREAFVIAIMRGLVIIVPLVLLLGYIWGMTGVWLSFILTELVVAVISLYMTSPFINKKK